jgi:tetratricopeptide (TPR) repeat protein
MLSHGYTFMGELRKALSICEDNLAMCKRIKFEIQISGSLGGLGHCYHLLGEWEKSLRCLQESLDIGRRIGEYQFSAEAAQWLGELFTEMGDYDEAEKHLQESNNLLGSAGDTSDQLRTTYPSLAKLYLKTGQIEKAEELINMIQKNVTDKMGKFIIPHTDVLKAMLLREQKKWDQSLELFEKSLQSYRSLDAQKWNVEKFAELLCEYGLVYLERNSEGDREKAYSLLDKALAIYQKMEAQKRIEGIIAKKKLLTA